MKFNLKRVLSQELEDLTKLSQRLGAIVDFVKFKYEDNEFDTYKLCQYTAIAGMETFTQKPKIGENGLVDRTNLFYEIELQDYFESNFYQILPQGSEISSNEFLGCGYNWQNNEFDFQKCHENMQGLVYALINAPHSYGFQVVNQVAKKVTEKEKQTVIFLRYFLEVLLNIDKEGKFIDNAIIFKWSDDWADYYFQDGKEWWGTFFWTIIYKEKKEIVVIGASATD